MVYVLYGLEPFFIKKELEEIKQKNHITELNISKYDFEPNLLDQIIEDANTVSLFSDNKLIIVENAFFLANNTKKAGSDCDLSKLEEYLNHMNPDTHLILMNDKVSMTKKICKLLKKVGVVKECTNHMNLQSVAKELLEGYQIDYDALQLLVSRANNISLLEQECIKLKLYKLDEKVITKEDVMELVTKNIDLDIFKLIDMIIKKNKGSAIEVYHEMLKYNEEPIKILILLANQFRLMFQAKTLRSKGYTEQDIAKQLEVHPYPVKLALEKSRSYPNETLLNLIHRLSDIDLQIKKGEVEKELALELFILGL